MNNGTQNPQCNTNAGYTQKITSRTESKEIGHDLNTQMDKNQLAVHIWEDHEVDKMPTCRSHFAAHPHDIIPRIQSRDMPYLSMSLIPAAGDEKLSMRPYQTSSGGRVSLGYLVDVAQDIPSRAIIPRMQEVTLNTGEHPTHKDFQVRKINESLLPEIRRSEELAYAARGVGKGMREMLQDFACTSEGAAATTTQLQALARYMANCKNIGNTIGDAENNIAGYNELLVAASHPHIKAIVINVLPSNKMIRRSYDASINLNGAIAGLMHLQEGVDLPVVRYHVDGERKGRCTWLGRGRKELMKIATQAIRELQNIHGAERFAEKIIRTPENADCMWLGDKYLEVRKGYIGKIKELTGIDIQKPLEEQLLAASVTATSDPISFSKA